MRRKYSIFTHLSYSNYKYNLIDFIPGYEEDDFEPGYQFSALKCYSDFYKRKEFENPVYKYSKAPIYKTTINNCIIGIGSWVYHSRGRISPTKIHDYVYKKYSSTITLLSYTISRNKTLNNY